MRTRGVDGGEGGGGTRVLAVAFRQSRSRWDNVRFMYLLLNHVCHPLGARKMLTQQGFQMGFK